MLYLPTQHYLMFPFKKSALDPCNYLTNDESAFLSRQIRALLEKRHEKKKRKWEMPFVEKNIPRSSCHKSKQAVG